MGNVKGSLIDILINLVKLIYSKIRRKFLIISTYHNYILLSSISYISNYDF